MSNLLDETVLSHIRDFHCPNSVLYSRANNIVWNTTLSYMDFQFVWDSIFALHKLSERTIYVPSQLYALGDHPIWFWLQTFSAAKTSSQNYIALQKLDAVNKNLQKDIKITSIVL